jgi:hypothetical protein
MDSHSVTSNKARRSPIGCSLPPHTGITSRLSACLLHFLCPIAIFVFAAVPTLAQNTGSISGTVTDSSGAAVPDASLRLTDVGTSQVRTTTSSAQGYFNFPDLPPTAYRLEVSAANFQKYIFDSLRLTVGQQMSLQPNLVVGGVSQSIQVAGTPPPIQTTTASVGQLIDTQQIEAAAAIGQEYFLLDAAWYIGSNGPQGFSGGVGNWDQVDSKKFPSGLAHFADYVRSHGLQFGLWFEPERVHRDSLLAKEHPDWIIWLDKENNYGLLDYGRVDAQQWAQDMMDRYITQLGIRYIRHDFNIDPLAYWDSRDPADRRGVSQIRHIEGFYKVIDRVRERHPATVLECCASGGRRIDLETARRFHTYWISDDSVDPEIIRFHLQGINYFLPGNYSYIQYTLPSPSQKHFSPNDFYYLSCFAGAFGVGGRVDLWPSDQKERFAMIEKIHKRIRPHLMEDYYPIMPQSLDQKGWDAWQFNNPRTNSGFVQAFRQESETPSLKMRLSGLHAGDSYEFEDPLTGATMQLTGARAMTEGLSFELMQMSSRILLYEPKTAKGG